MVRVKMCGIRSIDECRQALDAGVDAIGLLVGQVHASSDFISQPTAIDICDSIGPFVVPVLVTHLSDPDEIADLAAPIRCLAIQAHSDMSPADLRDLRRKVHPRRLIGKVSVDGPSAIDRSDSIQTAVDAILLDSIDRSTDRVGGTGMTHDWSLSATIVSRVRTPVILAGGLTESNVGDAIRQVRPWAVDVNSGVKRQDGTRSGELMARFAYAAKMSNLESVP
jgi:phosphoribosylanthranilate isomerase